jgi:hypothetical protein
MSQSFLECPRAEHYLYNTTKTSIGSALARPSPTRIRSARSPVDSGPTVTVGATSEYDRPGDHRLTRLNRSVSGQTSPKFPLRIWLAKPTVYRGAHTPPAYAIMRADRASLSTGEVVARAVAQSSRCQGTSARSSMESYQNAQDVAGQPKP